MKKDIFFKEYSGEELCDVDRDVSEAFDDFNESMIGIPTDEYNFIKGKFRVEITWCSEDDCDCTGFEHRDDCPHWTINRRED